ncbi:retrovirus-related pol polyprotein from transposon TNT 1-94 [Tanacetum coccineum]
MAAFKVLETQFQMFIKSWIYLDDEYVVMTRNYFLQYTQLEIPETSNKAKIEKEFDVLKTMTIELDIVWLHYSDSRRFAIASLINDLRKFKKEIGKQSPRSDLRWKPTDIPHIMNPNNSDVSEGTSINDQEGTRLVLSADTMSDMSMPANDVPAEQAPAIAPPTKTDDQILPSSKWVPIGKSNCVLDVQNCQLDEQWFNLHKDILRDTLDITLSNDNNPFVAPPSSDTIIEYVNTLGYPCTLRNGITHRSNIDYAERIWEEFVQSIQTFLTDRKNLATASHGKKKKTFHLLFKIRYVRKDGREIFGMPIPDALLTDAIKSAPYYSSYLEHVTEYQRYLNEEHDKADDKSPEPASSQPPKPTLDHMNPPRKTKLVDEVVDEGVPEKEPAHDDEEANLQRALELSLKEQGERTQGPARPVVIREPDSGRIQPLPEVQGKGKEKVAEEQAAHDLLTLQTPKPKNPADQFIFQRRTPMPTEPSEHADSPSLDAELALTDSETESEEEVPVIKAGDQDEGQAGPNPESQPQPSHVVHAGPNLEHMDLETTDASTQQKPEQMDEEFTTTAYPNVQENLKLLTEDQVILEEPASSSGTLSSLQNLDKDLSFTDQFFMEKPQEEEPGKTNAEAEV